MLVGAIVGEYVECAGRREGRVLVTSISFLIGCTKRKRKLADRPALVQCKVGAQADRQEGNNIVVGLSAIR